jgi:uncharacterized protein (DUF2267 family)
MEDPRTRTERHDRAQRARPVHLFDMAVQNANLWVKDMMKELGTSDPEGAAHALRAGLHALRDRLTIEEAAQLAAQLPVLIRGIFFEGWRPSGKPLRVRRRVDFLQLVRDNYAPRCDIEPDRIVAATFHLLDRNVSGGELKDIYMILPTEVAGLSHS